MVVYLNNRRFADDDIIFIAISKEELEIMIKELEETSKKVGLIINEKKNQDFIEKWKYRNLNRQTKNLNS